MTEDQTNSTLADFAARHVPLVELLPAEWEAIGFKDNLESVCKTRPGVAWSLSRYLELGSFSINIQRMIGQPVRVYGGKTICDTHYYPRITDCHQLQLLIQALQLLDQVA